MMKKSILALLIVGFSSSLVAQETSEDSSGRNLGWDYGANFSGRSYPLAASASVEGGYSQLFWGEWQKKNDFNYGYIRPSLKLTTAGVINAADAKITLKPISFVGFHAGRMISSRQRDNAPGANCDLQECRGVLESQYVQADLALKVKSYFYMGGGEFKNVKSRRDELPFYDDLPAVIGKKGDDRIKTVHHTLGYRFSDHDLEEKMVALNFRRSDAEDSKSYSERVGVAYGQRFGDYKVLLLAGSYLSDFQKRGPTAAIQIDWMGGLKGLAL